MMYNSLPPEKQDAPGRLFRGAATPAEIYRAIHKTVSRDCYIVSKIYGSNTCTFFR